jgi:hypothetical protein
MSSRSHSIAIQIDRPNDVSRVLSSQLSGGLKPRCASHFASGKRLRGRSVSWSSVAAGRFPAFFALPTDNGCDQMPEPLLQKCAKAFIGQHLGEER